MKSILQIGKFQITPNLILAPMSGITNYVFRSLIRKLNPSAVGLTVSEFISIEALTRGSRLSLEMMQFLENDRPVSIQIFGYDIGRMVDAAKMVEDSGADIVDINCGCPVPKVVRRGGGCELMRQPEHLEKIIRAVRAAVKIPLTLKIRSGWDENSRNALTIAKMAEDSGIDMLAIHGRTRSALYRGLADWEIVAQVADALMIPVVGSGDIVDIESAKRALELNVSGLMIGRGSMTNPWIFSEIVAHLQGETYKIPKPIETVFVLQQYSSMLQMHFPQKAVLGKLKSLASQVTRRVPGSASIRKSLCQSQSIEMFGVILEHWAQELIK